MKPMLSPEGVRVAKPFFSSAPPRLDCPNGLPILQTQQQES